jgi:hypothetical protein
MGSSMHWKHNNSQTCSHSSALFFHCYESKLHQTDSGGIGKVFIVNTKTNLIVKKLNAFYS